MTEIRLWDLPLRLFHWALAVAVAAAFVTAKVGWLEAHALCGLAVLGLLVFRLAWGFVGSSYARFVQFVRGPRALRAYLRGQWQGAGHNPLGALSVLAMLAVLLAQVLTGLVATDDSGFYGPLAALVDRETTDLASSLHRLQEVAVMLLVLLHVAAILFHRVRGENLVTPMLTGRAVVRDPAARDAQGGGVVALCLAVALAAGAVYAASGALNPPPPPPAEAPAW